LPVLALRAAPALRGRSAGRKPLHHLRARGVEPELPVQRVHVCRVQQPLQVCERPMLDHLAYERLPQSAAAVLREHVDVGEVDERDAVGNPTADPDVALAVVQPDHAVRIVDERVLDLVRATARPVALLADEAVDGGTVDSRGIVVELEAVPQRPPHADNVLRRKPPCSSYDEVTTARASRRARSERPASCASASGEERSSSTPARPSAERRSAPPPWTPHTAPPARASKPTSPSGAPHSTQLVRCGR